MSGGFCTHLEESASVLLYFKAPLSRHTQRLQIEKAGEFCQNMLVGSKLKINKKNVYITTHYVLVFAYLVKAERQIFVRIYSPVIQSVRVKCPD